MKKAEDFKDIFAELKAEYLESFAEKLSVIESFWQKNDRKNLEMEYHKIKGTGTTYGVQEASKVAEVMELLCRKNNPFLGKCILISTELFKKIRQHYQNPESEWSIDEDSHFIDLCQHRQQEEAS